eukprot:2777141-Prymnesium_polylepis.1
MERVGSAGNVIRKVATHRLSSGWTKPVDRLALGLSLPRPRWLAHRALHVRHRACQHTCTAHTHTRVNIHALALRDTYRGPLHFDHITRMVQ